MTALGITDLMIKRSGRLNRRLKQDYIDILQSIVNTGMTTTYQPIYYKDDLFVVDVRRVFGNKAVVANDTQWIIGYEIALDLVIPIDNGKVDYNYTSKDYLYNRPQCRYITNENVNLVAEINRLLTVVRTTYMQRKVNYLLKSSYLREFLIDDVFGHYCRIALRV